MRPFPRLDSLYERVNMTNPQKEALRLLSETDDRWISFNGYGVSVVRKNASICEAFPASMYHILLKMFWIKPECRWGPARITDLGRKALGEVLAKEAARKEARAKWEAEEVAKTATPLLDERI